jgi:hypothetical protein
MVYCSYAKNISEGKVQELSKHWIKVTYQDAEGGDETLIWYGNIEDSVVNEQGLRVEYYGLSIENQLKKLKLTETYAENVNPVSDAQRIGELRFNRNMDEGMESGLRGTIRYHFAAGADFSTVSAEPLAADTAYAFGTSVLWENVYILEHLLAVNAPSGGRHDFAPIGFRLQCTTAAQQYLDFSYHEWDLTGKDLFESVDEIIRASGPLLWWCDAVPYDAGEQDYILIRVQSRLEEDELESKTLHAIDRDDCMPAMIRRRVLDRATKVIARGERMKVMFTVAATGTPHWENGWTAAQEAAWKAAKITTEYDAEKWRDVFCKYIIPYNQEVGGADHNSTWEVFVTPDLNANPVGSKILVTGGEDAANFYAYPRRLLPHSLTFRGWTNPTANDGTLPTPPAGDPGNPELTPLMGWWQKSEGGGADIVIRLENLAVLRNEPGVQFPIHYRDNVPGIAESAMTAPLIFTVSMETDNFLEWHEPAAWPDDDQARIEVIEVPDCAWWAACSGTVVEVAAGGTQTTIYGVLRNDLPKLKEKAENLAALLRCGTYGGSTLVPHYHGTIPFKSVRLEYDDEPVELGDFVDTYGPFNIQAPIMTISHELASQQHYGTTLTCFKPWTQADTP